MLSCEICDQSENLRFCGRCGAASYCGEQHQKEHWEVHKKSCKKILKEKRKDQSRVVLNGSHNGSKQSNCTGHPVDNMRSVLTDIGDLSLRAENPEFMPQWVAQNSIALNPFGEYGQDERKVVGMISSNLKQYGICVIDKFMDESSATLCLEDAKRLHSLPNYFKPGQVVNQKVRERIRGDEIVWLDGTEQDTQNISYVCRRIDTIIHKCNSCIGYKISQRTKAMLACYPGKGTAYKCHIDNPSGDGRCITAIYYMNKDWDRKAMGGVLRMYPKATKTQVAEVEPTFNRLLLFYSDRRNPHEVLPAYAERYAVTIWYFDEEERSNALATWAKNLPRK